LLSQGPSSVMIRPIASRSREWKRERRERERERATIAIPDRACASVSPHVTQRTTPFSGQRPWEDTIQDLGLLSQGSLRYDKASLSHDPRCYSFSGQRRSWDETIQDLQ